MSRTDLSAVETLSLSEIDLIINHSTAWREARITPLVIADIPIAVPPEAEATTVTWGSGVTDVTWSVDGMEVLRSLNDVPDVYSWTSRDHVYDAETGILRESTMVYDNGGVQTSYYDAEGARTHRIAVNADLGEGLSFKTYTYQASGKMDTIFIRYGDGRELTISYDEDGRKSGEIHVDVENVFDWAVRSENFNADGKHTSTLRIDDDGMQYDTTYNGRGEVVEKLYQDLGDRWSWAIKHWSYDDDGALIVQTVVADDGTVTTSGPVDDMAVADALRVAMDSFEWNDVATPTDPATIPDDSAGADASDGAAATTYAKAHSIHFLAKWRAADTSESTTSDSIGATGLDTVSSTDDWI
ncbi:hypothetical protein [Jannaschia sp. 2305UL9-9]|uniref:hypothetical protein n=1 Tax=Jannaschia sp. 2305UL9-9 TaxID=3121638 RepID=UPI003528F63C